MEDAKLKQTLETIISATTVTARLTQIMLVVMKIMGIIEISWTWALFPTWCTLGIGIGCIMVSVSCVLTAKYIKDALKDMKESKDGG